jgi:hypothetical protein
MAIMNKLMKYPQWLFRYTTEVLASTGEQDQPPHARQCGGLAQGSNVVSGARVGQVRKVRDIDSLDTRECGSKNPSHDRIFTPL